MHHRLDGIAHEVGGVIDDGIFQPVGEILRKLRHGGADIVADLDGVGARGLEDGQRHRLLVVQQRTQAILRGVNLHPRHITQPRNHAAGILDDDLLELFGVGKPALDIDGKLQLAGGAIGRAIDDAGRHLDILLAHRGDHIIGGQAQLGDLLRVQPQPHGIVARTEQLHAAHALDLGQLVLDVQHRIVAQVQHVVAAAGRAQMHHHGQVG